MEKSNRPQRNRRHSRRAWPPDDDLHYLRPTKRLFTPEIKRMLKEWLVRRRENPYPSREEKKRLAVETGLTYTQICNWFANWRRKLKNSEREKSKKSWGHLIKHYNNNARGNVEQFSISSEDSIWEEEEQQRRNKMNAVTFNGRECDDEDDEDSSLCDIEGSYISGEMERSAICGNGKTPPQNDVNSKIHCYTNTPALSKSPLELFIGREVDVLTTAGTCHITNFTGNSHSLTTKTKYKHKIMEKYLRDTSDATQSNSNFKLHSVDQDLGNIPTTDNNTTIYRSGAELSKWLESAAKFTPTKNNYYIEWNSKRNKLEKEPAISKTFLPNANLANLQTSLMYSNTSVVQKENSQDYNDETASRHHQHIYDVIHHKDELDAAEALANLAFNCRQKILDSATTNSRNSISWPLNAISS